MPGTLIHNSYGKSCVRLTKVTRHAGRHDLTELTVDIELEGDFSASYLQGDNATIVATDSMKNIVYARAREHLLTSIESFGQALAEHFLNSYAQVARVTIGLAEHAWQRLTVQGAEHPHAFVAGSKEKRTSIVSLTHEALRIEAGVDDLVLLKTTNSAFSGFLRDRYTTLPDTGDRILATALSARWLYQRPPGDWTAAFQTVRTAMLEAFASHQSLSVQQTLHVLGDAALAACAAIEQIQLRMPNKHRLLVNLQPFGLDNDNEIFVATDEPYGLITGTLRRS